MILLIVMFNLISLFRGLNIENTPLKFGKGSLWKVIGPLGYFVGTIFGKNDYFPECKIPYIIGIVFNLILVISMLLM